MPHLFEPLKIKEITLRNRIAVSPMCMYSSDDGFINDWHVVHLGSRAVGGAGLVMTEATAVEARGRISPQDLGIWKDAHIAPMARVTRFIKEHGAVPGIQLAHAGRKASTYRPWDEGDGAISPDNGGWQVVAPSALPFSAHYPHPAAMSRDDIQTVQQAFAKATARAVAAGFEWLEIHAAHGYLLHQFLSPLSNNRGDEYGGSFENRIRFLIEATRQIRAAWPEHLPFAVRVSATDWAEEGGWEIEQTVALAKELKFEGVDLIDCSSGGTLEHPQIPTGAGYQVPFAERVKRDAEIAVGAVGLITDPAQADELIRNGRADIISMAREMLRDPYWPLHAARVLHQKDKAPVPVQYERAF